MVTKFFPDEPYYSFYRKRDQEDGTVLYEDFEKGLETVQTFIAKHGPFDGALGFSQGGIMLQVVLAMQRDGALSPAPNFKFAICLVKRIVPPPALYPQYQ